MIKHSNPYSQHFRCVARLFQNSVRNDIFMFLLDEHLQLLRQNRKDPIVPISNRDIGEKAGVNRNIVPSHLKALDSLRVIDLGKGYCKVNMDYLINVVTLFNKQSCIEDYQKIRTAFQKSDIDKLREYGLKEDNQSDSLELLSGSIENAQMCATLPKSVPSGLNVCQDAQMCATLPKSVPLCTYIGMLKEEYGSSDELYAAIAGRFTSPNAQMCARKFADMIFDAQMCATVEQESELLGLIVQLFTEMVVCSGTDVCTQVAQMCASGGTDIGHRNKYRRENNKRINQSEALDIRGEEWNENDERDESADGVEAEEPCVNFHEPLKIIELKDFNHLSQEEEDMRTLRSSKQVYPYFSAEEIDYIVNDIHKACESPLKLFLYNMWGYASEMTNTNPDYPDEDEEQDFSDYSSNQEVFFDPEGQPLSYSDYRQLIEGAYEQTEDYIRQGYPDEDENIKLQFTEMFDWKLLSQIFDWKKVALDCKSRSVVVSKSGIRDVETQCITEDLKKPNNRLERREAAIECREMMKEIWELKNNPSQLTSIEQIILYILQEHFEYSSEDGFSAKNGGMIYRDDWRRLSVEISKHKLSTENFFKCIVACDGPNEEQFSLSNFPFYVPAVKYINNLFQQTSAIKSLKNEN